MSRTPALFRRRFPKLPINDEKCSELERALTAAELNRSERKRIQKHLQALSKQAPDKSRNPNHFSTVLPEDDAIAFREAVALSGKSRAAFLRDLMRDFLVHNPFKQGAA